MATAHQCVRIVTGVGVSSTNTVNYHKNWLTDDGLIDYIPWYAAPLRIVEALMTENDLRLILSRRTLPGERYATFGRGILLPGLDIPAPTLSSGARLPCKRLASISFVPRVARSIVVLKAA